jgi:hypothetical protein
MEEERHETFAHLTGIVGKTADEAERMMRDDGLWLLEPELRLDVPDEEAVKQWRTACNVLADLADVADSINLATVIAVMDAGTRASIALERTRERVRQAREEG